MKMYHVVLSSVFIIFFLSAVCQCNAATRWSSLHLLPDADLLDNNNFVINADLSYISDSLNGAVFKPGGLLTYSIVKWVNIEIGYADKFTFGLKARVLGNESAWMPSLALGIRGCISSRELHLYDYESDSADFNNELFLVFGKSVEPIRLRFHLGIMSIPDNKRERINPFIALEKYFGGGVYTTIEMQRRDHEFVPSLFVSWRFWQQKIEVSAGAIALTKMLLDNNDDFDAGISTSARDGIVHPGFYFGIRFHGKIGPFGSSDGLEPLENQVQEHKRRIIALQNRLDSVESMVSRESKKTGEMEALLATVTDSTMKSKVRYRTIAIEKLNSLRVFYSQEPFEPELVKKGYDEIVGFRNEMVPTLFELTFDLELDKKIRILAVSVLGMIGTPKALDVLIDILSQSKESDVLIEALISLGKNKETRAVYLMKQLANDPNDALAFTAREVLKKLDPQSVSKDSKPRKMAQPVLKIPEKKIGTATVSSPQSKEKNQQSADVNQSDSSEWFPEPDSITDSNSSAKSVNENGSVKKTGK